MERGAQSSEGAERGRTLQGQPAKCLLDELELRLANVVELAQGVDRVGLSADMRGSPRRDRR